MIDRYREGYEGSAVAVDAKGIEELSSARRLRTAGWLVIATLPTSIAFESINSIRDKIHFGATLSSLLIPFLLWLYLHGQLTPLSRAALTLDVMTQGRTPLQPLLAEGSKEIRHLLHSFNLLQRHISEQETSLRDSAEQLRISAKVFESSCEGIVITDSRMCIVSVNSAFTEMTGYGADKVIGSSLQVLDSERDDRRFLTRIGLDLQHAEYWQGEVEHRRKNGETYPAWLHVSVIRDSDTICRQGGDEFLIVLGNVQDTNAITTVTQKILETLAATFDVEGNELSTSSSISIAVFPDDGRDIDTLLKLADTAMYHAKEAGRNAYSFFTKQMNLDAVEHQRIRVGLLHALERGEFRLHYQPQIDLASGAVVGAEALIRWNHPERGTLAPEHFIAIAEESGLIVPIGAWVLREACRQAAAWRKSGLPQLVVAVNVSAIQFKRGDLEACVRQALEESGLPPACLELELTESILIHDADQVIATLQRLKLLGVKLSIDDFGTGYSSLSYLTRFKVDKLKIDRSFVCDIQNQPGNASMVRAIILMARSLNLKTIAEGVEDKELVAFLRSQHCGEAQGYYYSRPIAAIEFAHYLSHVHAAAA